VNLTKRALAVAGVVAMAGGMITTDALPASATIVGLPAGSCGGAFMLATVTPGLSDTLSEQTMTTSLPKDITTHVPIGGTCIQMKERLQDENARGAPPTSISVGSIATKLVGVWSCRADPTSNRTAPSAYPLTGKQTITSVPTQTDLLGKKWQIQSYITFEGFESTGFSNPDLVDVTGVVSKGLSVGAVETAKYWMEPVVKSVDPEGDGTNNPTADGPNHNDDNLFNTGYSVDDNAMSQFAQCFGGGPSVSPFTEFALGGGGATATSPLGNVVLPGASYAIP
jgi:hypothetical protein